MGGRKKANGMGKGRLEGRERRDCEEGGKILAVLLFWESGGGNGFHLIYGHGISCIESNGVPVQHALAVGTRYLGGVWEPLRTW